MFQDGNLFLDEMVKNNDSQILKTVGKDSFPLNYTNDSSHLLLPFYRDSLTSIIDCEHLGGGVEP